MATWPDIWGFIEVERRARKEGAGRTPGGARRGGGRGGGGRAEEGRFPSAQSSEGMGGGTHPEVRLQILCVVEKGGWYAGSR